MPDKIEAIENKISGMNTFIASQANTLDDLEREINELKRWKDSTPKSKAGQILSKEFVQRRAEEVGSDAYQLAKKAFMRADDARTAFEVLIDYIFQIYDLDEQVDYLTLNMRSIGNQLETLRGKIDMKVDEKLRQTFGIAHGAIDPAEEAKEKGPLLQRIASCEQKLNSLRPRAASLREDGKFLEQYERFKSDTQTYNRILVEHMQKKKPWWKFWS